MAFATLDSPKPSDLELTAFLGASASATGGAKCDDAYITASTSRRLSVLRFWSRMGERMLFVDAP